LLGAGQAKRRCAIRGADDERRSETAASTLPNSSETDRLRKLRNIGTPMTL